MFCEESLGKNHVFFVCLTYEGVDQNLVMEIKFMLDSFSRCLGMSHVGLSSITKILSKMTTDLKTNYDAEMCTLLRC